jgi:hypothetical protein
MVVLDGNMAKEGGGMDIADSSVSIINCDSTWEKVQFGGKLSF